MVQRKMFLLVSMKNLVDPPLHQNIVSKCHIISLQFNTLDLDHHLFQEIFQVVGVDVVTIMVILVSDNVVDITVGITIDMDTTHTIHNIDLTNHQRQRVKILENRTAQWKLKESVILLQKKLRMHLDLRQ
jgi:hypothetical protein